MNFCDRGRHKAVNQLSTQVNCLISKRLCNYFVCEEDFSEKAKVSVHNYDSNFIHKALFGAEAAILSSLSLALSGVEYPKLAHAFHKVEDGLTLEFVADSNEEEIRDVVKECIAGRFEGIYALHLLNVASNHPQHLADLKRYSLQKHDLLAADCLAACQLPEHCNLQGAELDAVENFINL